MYAKSNYTVASSKIVYEKVIMLKYGLYDFQHYYKRSKVMDSVEIVVQKETVRIIDIQIIKVPLFHIFLNCFSKDWSNRC